MRSCNWLRTDTIFIENEQIEELSNRPPWTGVSVEVGMSDGSPKSLKLDEGVTYTDNVVHHARRRRRMLLLAVELAPHSGGPHSQLLPPVSRRD